MQASTRWKQRPDGSNWGEFGPDDQSGRLNLLTPAKVRQGVAEVREGLSFCLSLPLDYPGGNALAPHRKPPQRQATQRQGRAFTNYGFSNEGNYSDCGCDDAVLLHTQYSTQWDSLAHIGCSFDAMADGNESYVYYNGYRAGLDVMSPDAGLGVSALGIENMATTCVQGRAVMVDLQARFGDGRRYVGYDDLMRTMDECGAQLESGDILCLHTGFAQRVLDMQRQPDAEALHQACAVLDGGDDRLLQWITDSNVAAIAADNYAIEGIPARLGASRRPFVPLHVHCLFKLGVHLGELWQLGELNRWLKAHGRTRFLLTAPPLRLPGAAGSPVTPVGTV
ncbi:cyclase family protein [soil metagenome]